MQGTMPGARRRGRPRTARMDNSKTWTGLPVEESIRMTEDRDKWRKYVQPSEQGRLKNRTEENNGCYGATVRLSGCHSSREQCQSTEMKHTTLTCDPALFLLHTLPDSRLTVAPLTSALRRCIY